MWNGRKSGENHEWGLKYAMWHNGKEEGSRQQQGMVIEI